MTHDPGGKVRTVLPTGMMGNAILSPCGRYRPILTRFWAGLLVEPDAYALWIGMNPSTADANFNDPTVTREVIYTQRRLGLGSYVKCNISDYRATDPKVFRTLPRDERRSSVNLPTIVTQAAGAKVVIFAFGAVDKCLRDLADETVAAVRELGRETFCVGYTKDGFPRHPLYMPGDPPLLPYPRPPEVAA